MKGMEFMLRNMLNSLGVNAESIMEVAEMVRVYIEQSQVQSAEILARVQRMEEMTRALCEKNKLPVPALEGEVSNGLGN